MARRKSKPKSFDEQIALIETQIAEYQQTIDDLKKQLKVAHEGKKQEQIDTLLTTITNSGRTIEDIIKQLQSKNITDKSE